MKNFMVKNGLISIVKKYILIFKLDLLITICQNIRQISFIIAFPILKCNELKRQKTQTCNCTIIRIITHLRNDTCKKKCFIQSYKKNEKII